MITSTHRQTITVDVASSVWTIVHGGVAAPAIQVFVLYNDKYERIIPLSIDVSTAGTAVIEFSQPFTGYVTVG